MRNIRLWVFWTLLFEVATRKIALADENPGATADEGQHGEEAEPAFAVLFPWFTQAIGVFIFFILTRSFHGLPYTAVLFLIGTIIGIGATESGSTDELTESIKQWGSINGEVLLLVFLPGLLFRDAFTVNFHLFTKAFGQLFIMAIIMVLMGTILTGVVAKEVLPYQWTWSLALTFGSILSATDPVAVAALLNEVGAPPRLKMHISGESMLNDGSAMVFYIIFSSMFLYDLDLPGGEDVSWGRGFAIFFRMAGGGMALGVAFGLGLLLMLDILNRRLDNEENVLQVAATVTVAYLSFYTAEMACGMSGVISVVFCGITTRAFGVGFINNPEMMENFWILLEHLLNTLLFALGGVVWGMVLTGKGDRQDMWTGKDWGYLILLYVLVMAIRGVLVAMFYPILSRIGLKTTWQESTFIWWGGLRGAVGIALAISLDEKVWATTDGDKPDDVAAREDVTKLFGIVGGIAFLTLVINGTSAGPVIRKLGLAHSTEVRKQVVHCFERGLRKHIIDILVDRMTHPLFCHVHFALVRHHVPLIADMTIEDLKSAVARRKDEMNPKNYTAPHLGYMIPYLIEPNDSHQSEESGISTSLLNDDAVIIDGETEVLSESTAEVLSHAIDEDAPAVERVVITSDSFAATKQQAIELRMVFIELVRAKYTEYMNSGAMDARQYEGILAFSLTQSLDIAADAASKGQPLCDWEHSQIELNQWTYEGKRKVWKGRGNVQRRVCCGPEWVDLVGIQKIEAGLEICRGIAFIFAHHEAQENFRSYFVERGIPVPPAERLVLEEIAAEIKKAEGLLKSFDEALVKSVLSHILCLELLNGGAKYIEMLLEGGLLKQREGHGYLQSFDKNIHKVEHCDLQIHPDELSEEDRADIVRKMKSSFMEDSTKEASGSDKQNAHPWLRGNMKRRHSAAPSKFF